MHNSNDIFHIDNSITLIRTVPKNKKFNVKGHQINIFFYQSEFVNLKLGGGGIIKMIKILIIAICYYKSDSHLLLQSLFRDCFNPLEVFDEDEVFNKQISHLIMYFILSLVCCSSRFFCF